ncbi:MAG: VOC family protein [Planctomycetes bacterium]|nr:VOC family protein [Planctomycetota bacterium]
MIRGVHGLFYSSEAEAARAFFKDKVKLPGVDIGEGWWIFDFAEGDIGVHPIDHGVEPGEHNVSFYCDDIHGTVADMKKRGVEFVKPVEDHGYGFVTFFKAPGGITIQLYEPKYSKKPAKKSAAKKSAAKKPAKKAGKNR